MNLDAMNHITPLKRLTCFGLVVCLQHSLTVAQTQSLTNSQASSEVVSKLADIKKLISAVGTENLLKQSFPVMIAQFRQAMPQVPDKIWSELEKPASINELIELCIPIYEKYFTHEDIKGMLAFYETSVGKKTVAKMPIVMQESMEAGNKWGRELLARVEKISSPNGRVHSPPTGVADDSDQQGKEISRMAPDDLRIGRQLLINQGMNPDEWEITPINGSYVGTVPKRKTLAENTEPVSLAKDIRYVIRHKSSSGENTTYYSRDEPKPYGNGFKFKLFPKDIEVTLSGDVEIIKIPASTNGK